jgi:protein involved in polysaccharide export with SLBB domain
LVHRSLDKVDPATVSVPGEVARPAKYQLGAEVTAADPVRFANGLKLGAYTETTDLTRYEMVQGASMAGEMQTVQIAKAMAVDPDTKSREFSQ